MNFLKNKIDIKKIVKINPNYQFIGFYHDIKY